MTDTITLLKNEEFATLKLFVDLHSSPANPNRGLAVSPLEV